MGQECGTEQFDFSAAVGRDGVDALSSSAAGIEIVRTAERARKLVGICFGKGYLPHRHDARDRMRGSVLFQVYEPDCLEWRTARIGDSYFANQKVKKGEFHSGSREAIYCRPPDDLLDLCRSITEHGPFLSMGVDVLQTPDGRYRVNEMPPVFGCKREELTIVDGEPGRLLRDADSGEWRFEPGRFCRNTLCNLRIRTLLEQLCRPLPGGHDDAAAFAAQDKTDPDASSSHAS